MRLYLDLKKSADQRGEDRGGSYLKRVVTGKDKDGSPQYRYLRTQEEVDAYEKKHGKITHEDQKKRDEEIKEDTSKKDKKKPSLLVKEDKDKVEKGLYVR